MEENDAAVSYVPALLDAYTEFNTVEVEADNTDSFVFHLTNLDDAFMPLLESSVVSLLKNTSYVEMIGGIQTKFEKCLTFFKSSGAIEEVIRRSFVPFGSILKITFQFCHLGGELCTSNKVFVNQNEDLTLKLSTIFKQCYANLKFLMEAMDLLHNVFPSDLNFFYKALVTLIGCSEVLSSIDIMACVTVWKAIKKVYVQHRELVLKNDSFGELLQVCDITSTTLSHLFESLERKDGDLTSKYQKVSRFLLGIVLLFVDDFKDRMTEEMGQKVFGLIHLIQKLSLLETRKEYELKDCSSEYETMYNNLLCVNDPLIKSFLQSSNSPHITFKGILDLSSKEQNLVACLQIIVNILEYLTEHTERHSAWFRETIETECSFSIFDLVFELMNKCSSYMFSRHMEYSVIDKSKCPKETSLYQIILGKMCAFVVTLSAELFLVLEKVLLEQVLFGTNYSLLLATDLWSFIARWGKADLCMSFFVFFGKLLLRLGNSDILAVRNVSFLLRRLFWFLEESQHAELLKKFPVSRNTTILWKVIPSTQMKGVDTSKISTNIIEVFLTMTEELSGSPEKQTQKQIIAAIECLSCLLQSDSDVYTSLDKVVRHRISDRVITFWKKFSDTEETIEIDLALIMAMLELTSTMLIHIQGKHLHEILTIICDILHNSDDQTFQLGCANLLSVLRTLKFEAEHENNCLQLLSKMFQFLLTRTNWLVEDASMRSLQQFAQETKYSRALVTFLPASKKKDFTRFLKREACSVAVPDEEVTAAVVEYLSKCSAGSFNGILDTMENSVKKLLRLSKNDRPAEVSQRIDNLISLLRSAVR